jgi:hypothetical protein
MHLLTWVGFGLIHVVYTYNMYTQDYIVNIIYNLPPTLIPLSGNGTKCFLPCCDKDSAFIFTTGAAWLTSILLETGVDANYCKPTEPTG